MVPGALPRIATGGEAPCGQTTAARTRTARRRLFKPLPGGVMRSVAAGDTPRRAHRGAVPPPGTWQSGGAGRRHCGPVAGYGPRCGTVGPCGGQAFAGRPRAMGPRVRPRYEPALLRGLGRRQLRLRDRRLHRGDSGGAYCETGTQLPTGSRQRCDPWPRQPHVPPPIAGGELRPVWSADTAVGRSRHRG